MNFSIGEQKIIYKKQGNIFNCYHVKVVGQNKRHITIVDLDDKEKEKTFNISRVVEVLHSSASEEIIKEKISKHTKDYENRKLPSSFSHGGFFTKAKGHVLSDGTLVLKLSRSRQTKERDIKVFKLIIYAYQKLGKSSMGHCKSFVKDAGPALLGYSSLDNFDYYHFTAEGKKDLVERLKEEVSDSKEYLKELIQNCKDDGDDPKLDKEVLNLKEEIKSDSNYLKIVRGDYRQELINFFAGEYYRKYDDGIFYDISREFPIRFEES